MPALDFHAPLISHENNQIMYLKVNQSCRPTIFSRIVLFCQKRTPALPQIYMFLQINLNLTGHAQAHSIYIKQKYKSLCKAEADRSETKQNVDSIRYSVAYKVESNMCITGYFYYFNISAVYIILIFALC